MKLLVTGINGMVASYLAELFLERGHEVVGTYRWQEDMSNIQHIKDKIKMVYLNINDLSNCIKVIEQEKPDVISHLAAESYVSDSFDHPEESIRTNGLGTYKLLEAIRIVREMINIPKNSMFFSKNAVKIFDPVIHICSSSEVYGLVTKKDVPIKENQIFNPTNPYACGKVLADVLARMYYTNYGLKTITTRMFTHFSSKRMMLSAEVNIANQIARIEKGLQEPILKHGNLDSIRTWADVKDACEAYYLILTKPKRFGEVYNIGGNVTKTIREMLKTMLSFSKMKDKIKLKQDPKLLRKYDVTLQIPNILKFQKDYPEWKAKIEFSTSILELLNAKRKIYEKEKNRLE